MSNFGRLYRSVVRSGLSRIVCVSSAVAKKLNIFAGFVVPSTVIHNAIDPNEASRIFHACTNKEVPISNIGYIGRISVEKGVEDLLKVLSNPNFKSNYPAVSLLIFTDETGAKSLVSRKTELPSCQIFTGLEKENIYSTIGTVVIASRFEGFSLVCLEAMTAGLNIVYRRELEAVCELLDTVRYPAKKCFGFSNTQEMFRAIADASISFPHKYQDTIDLSPLSFSQFGKKWRQFLFETIM